MNADSNEFLRRMEQATSSAHVECASLDEETAVLRENWLALGKLLSAAESELQPQQIDVVELRRLPMAPKRSSRLVWGCVASVLAVGGLWFVYRTMPSPDEARPMVNRLPSEDLPEAGVQRTESPRTANGGVMELAWEDDWDRGFAQAALVLRQFRGESTTRDSSLSRLQGEFQEVAREFESGSL